MPAFQYIAQDQTGRSVSGVLSATSRQEVLSMLSGQSLLPVELKPTAEKKKLWSGVSGADKAATYSLLADLLESGVPIARALEILIEQMSKPQLQSALTEIREQVVDGNSLADGMRAHRHLFSDLAISMVRAGEEGGFLEDSLKRIANFTEKQEAMKGRVLGALAYPTFLLIIGTLVVIGMMMFFVPRFAPMFDRLRDQGGLPTATVLLLAVSEFLRNWAVIITLGLVGAGYGCMQYINTKNGSQQWDRFKLKLGPLGLILRNLAIARFCRALGTLLSNGVPLLKSLSIAREATANRTLSDAIGEVTQNVKAGKSLVDPLAASGQFPKDILEMIHVGEQSNRLESLLIDIANKIEERTERKLDVLVKLIEPALMLVMALLIGFLVVALLLPVFESSGNLG